MFFGKVKKKENKEETITYENLCMPEIHTGKCHLQSSEKNTGEEPDENLAIPEIHISKKSK